jgi:hypothetical protein
MAWSSLSLPVTGTPIASAWGATVKADLDASAAAVVTTAGDLVYATGANALARLGIGQAGQPLMVNVGATAPAWPDVEAATTTMGLGRRTTANAIGNSFVFAGGDASAGATDKDGGTAIVSGGVATGNGGSQVSFRTALNNQGAGTADRAAAARWVITAPGHLTAFADNTYDIGAAGATRPRNIYLGGLLTVPGAAVPLLTTTTTITTGAGAGAGTLTNAPAAGNPTKWFRIDDAGVTRWVPAW